jgi:aspartyl-tRNA(Asn)/glutamyl-tRNA(Gln) amidotransferase subunit B
MAEQVFPVKIGLEVHGYLDTVEKLFCMCRVRDTGDVGANSSVCPICTGTPGSKPMAVNEEAVRKMLQVACILGSRINMDDLIWQRKHYDWADNPKGYQITMSGPHAKVNAEGGKFGGINIWEMHLEEDPAQWNPKTGEVNYNRSGSPLIEIVTAPQFSSSEEVVVWLKKLIHSLSYVKAIRKNAGIKVDVNVSCGGERVEMKNLNSLEKIRKAIDYEIARQVESRENGVVQKQETRAYDEVKGKTVLMRSKENAADYRFIPDPDLAVLEIDPEMLRKLKDEMPEMPEVKLDRLLNEYEVGEEDAKVLAKNLELVEFFEELVGGSNRERREGEQDAKDFGGEGENDPRKDAERRGKRGKEAGCKGLDGGVKERIGRMLPWVTVELLRVLNYNKKTLEDEDVDIRPVHLSELIGAVEAGKITRLKGKQIMNDFVPKSFSLAEHGDEVDSISLEAVENLCRQVVEENAHVVEEYRGGKKVALNWLVGQVMRLSERRADFGVVEDVLKGMT